MLVDSGSRQTVSYSHKLPTYAGGLHNSSTRRWLHEICLPVWRPLSPAGISEQQAPLPVQSSLHQIARTKIQDYYLLREIIEFVAKHMPHDSRQQHTLTHIAEEEQSCTGSQPTATSPAMSELMSLQLKEGAREEQPVSATAWREASSGHSQCQEYAGVMTARCPQSNKLAWWGCVPCCDRYSASPGQHLKKTNMGDGSGWSKNRTRKFYRQGEKYACLYSDLPQA